MPTTQEREDILAEAEKERLRRAPYDLPDFTPCSDLPASDTDIDLVKSALLAYRHGIPQTLWPDVTTKIDAALNALDVEDDRDPYVRQLVSEATAKHP